MNNTCLTFAEAMARTRGISYAKATKKYPQAYNRGMVYLADGVSTVEAHCTHCARVEALASEKDDGDDVNG